MKRIFLFLLTNIAIIVLLSITLRILGVDSLLLENGSDLDLNALLVFSAVSVLAEHSSHWQFPNGWQSV